eukprot:5589919-Lingulodinium_polyedra.AAC.1
MATTTHADRDVKFPHCRLHALNLLVVGNILHPQPPGGGEYPPHNPPCRQNRSANARAVRNPPVLR